MVFREAIERDALDLLALGRRVPRPRPAMTPWMAPCSAISPPSATTYLAQERHLETAALTLRRAWLRAAHRPADASLKSPADGGIARVPCGNSLHFGYERDLDVSILEDRGAAYARPPEGWTSDMVIFRSGQAALASILQFVAAARGDKRTLSVAHAGAYFETRALLAAWPRHAPSGRRRRPSSVPTW
jgi:hypothetical protein